jgi:hypothetical protein
MSGLFSTSNLPIYDSNGNRSPVTVTSLTNYQHAYVVKYNDDGIPQWATIVSPDEGDLITAVVVADTNDTFYVAGRYNSISLGTLSFYSAGNPTAAIILPISSSEKSEVWLAKYNSNGTVLWATHLIADQITAAIVSVIVDKDHNVYLCGAYINTLLSYDVTNQVTPVATLAATGTGAISSFLVKYNTNGVYQWGTRVGSTTTNSEAVASTLYYHESGALCIAGYYTNNLSIYNAIGPSIVTLPVVNVSELFLVQYNTGGSYVWATHIGGNVSGDLINPTVTIDSTGSVYICGRYSSSIVNTYSASAPSTSVCTVGNSGQSDIFLAKFNNIGVSVWIANVGGMLSEAQVILAVDPNNNIILEGFTDSPAIRIYNGGVTLNPLPSPSTTKTLTNPSNYNLLLVKFNPSGQYQWVTYIGQTYNINIVPTLSCDISSNILVAGRFNARPGPVLNTLNAYRASDLVATLSLTVNFPDPPSTFFVKYSPSGVPIWGAKTLLGDNPDVDTPFKPWGP